MDALKRHVENHQYQCGDDLFATLPRGCLLKRTFAVARAIKAKVHRRPGGKERRAGGKNSHPDHRKTEDRYLCATPTDDLYYSSGLFDPTCAWCPEDDDFVDDATIASLGVRRKSRPICQWCFKQGKEVPYYGQFMNGGKVKRSSEQRRRRTIRQTSKAASPRGPTVQDLVRAGHLRFYNKGMNTACERCSASGDVVECWSCQRVWHLKCMHDGAATRPQTARLPAQLKDAIAAANEEKINWVCGLCFDAALRLYSGKKQECRVTRLGPRHKVDQPGRNVEIKIRTLGDRTFRYLCFLDATPTEVAAVHRGGAGKRDGIGASLHWDALLRDEGLERASRYVGEGMEEATLQDLGFIAGRVYTLQSIPAYGGMGDGAEEEAQTNRSRKQQTKLVSESSSSSSSATSSPSSSDAEEVCASGWLAQKQQVHSRSALYKGLSIVEDMPTGDLVSRPIMYKFNGAGWCKGKVERVHKCGRKCQAPCVYTHDVKYSDGIWPHLLCARRYGGSKSWVMLRKAHKGGAMAKAAGRGSGGCSATPNNIGGYPAEEAMELLNCRPAVLYRALSGAGFASVPASWPPRDKAAAAQGMRVAAADMFVKDPGGQMARTVVQYLADGKGGGK